MGRCGRSTSGPDSLAALVCDTGADPFSCVSAMDMWRRPEGANAAVIASLPPQGLRRQFS